MRGDNIESLPVLLGDSKSLFGIRTGPVHNASRTGTVMLNAGLLHNVGPFRLHVNIADRLARAGFQTVRLDQSGKGESPRRTGPTRAESLLLDYDDVLSHFDSIGVRETILIGLCSGADDALYIASKRNTVTGLILLDGYAPKNANFHLRHYANRVFKVGPWIRTFRRLVQSNDQAPDIDFREWEADPEMLSRISRILDSDTRMLTVFTAGQNYYNHLGQLGASLPDECKKTNLSEVFFDQVDHTYNVTYHRRRLLDQIETWVTANFPRAALASASLQRETGS